MIFGILVTLNLALWHYNFPTCAISLTCSHWQKKESAGFTYNQILQQLISLSNTFREEAISEMKASAVATCTCRLFRHNG